MEASDLAIRLIEYSESHPLSAAPTPAGRSTADSPAAVTARSTAPTSSNTSFAPSPTTVPAEIAGQQSSSSSAGIAAAAMDVEAVPARVVYDYGVVPSEPAEGEADVVRVSIKLVGGKAIVRKYRASDPVRSLFAVVLADMQQSSEGEVPAAGFDIMTRFPTLSLLTCLDQSLAECKLAGSNVFVKLL